MLFLLFLGLSSAACVIAIDDGISPTSEKQRDGAPSRHHKQRDRHLFRSVDLRQKKTYALIYPAFWRQD